MDKWNFTGFPHIFGNIFGELACVWMGTRQNHTRSHNENRTNIDFCHYVYQQIFFSQTHNDTPMIERIKATYHVKFPFILN